MSRGGGEGKILGCGVTVLAFGAVGCLATALAVSVWEGVRDSDSFLAPSTPKPPGAIQPTIESSDWYQDVPPPVQMPAQSGMETWTQPCGSLGDVEFQCGPSTGYCTGRVLKPTTSHDRVPPAKREQIAEYCAKQ